MELSAEEIRDKKVLASQIIPTNEIPFPFGYDFDDATILSDDIKTDSGTIDIRIALVPLGVCDDIDLSVFKIDGPVINVSYTSQYLSDINQIKKVQFT